MTAERDPKANIEAIYPLSPMQQGMLFQSLADKDPETNFQQLCYTLEGRTNPAALKEAWTRVVERHAVLRTLFVARGKSKPVQIVRKRIQLPWSELDLSDQPPDERQARVEELLREDRKKGFDLRKPGLFRLFLLNMGGGCYKFVWSFNHILLDGWGRVRVLQEVFALYDGLCHGQEPRLPPAVPFRRYISWLQKQDMAEAESFWKTSLAGFSEPTPLPGAAPEPEQSTEARAFGKIRVRLTADETEALESFTRRQRVTVNTLVQGAWALVLGRYADTDDVMFGVTVSGRPPELPGADDLVGILINTLPNRVGLPSQTRTGDWLRALQASQVAQRRFEYSPLYEVQKWCEVPRGQSLFESAMVFANYPSEQSLEKNEGDLRISDAHSFESMAYPLTLHLSLQAFPEKHLEMDFFFDELRFRREAVKELMDRYRFLLGQMTANPEARLDELEILDEDTRRRVLVGWNATDSAFPRDQCFHQRLARFADSHDIAVFHKGRCTTFAELFRRARDLAKVLTALGVGPDVPVAVFCERSPEMVIGLLAVLEAGGAYLPLDATYPSERLAFLLADSGAPVLLAKSSLLSRLPDHRAKQLCLDQPLPEVSAPKRAVAAPGPENIAYIIYTSGSTGKPKGVMVPHRALNNYLTWCMAEYRVASGQGAPVHGSLGFDATVTSLWAPLLAGRGIELIDEDREIQDLARSMCNDHAAGLAKVTPAHLDLLARILPKDPAALKTRTLVIGGEALSYQQLIFYREHLPGIRLINEYGPTETVVGCSAHEVRSNEPEEGPVPIGKPIANTRMYVLDRRMQPLPPHATDELFIGGEGLTRGYLGRPGLTASRFVPNPFGPSGSRLYRSGDRARYRGDGSLMFMGRLDDQVKLRGYRIELGEIEAALGRHPEVDRVAVLLREDQPGQRRLAAYVTLHAGAAGLVDPKAPGAALKPFLTSMLPEHMVPTAYVAMTEWPLTANGKIDRRALPEPGVELGGDDRFVAPSGPVEEALAEIWCALLDKDRVGTSDDFFALGGDSILATQLAFQVNERFRVDLDLPFFFRRPTLAWMASAVAGPSENRSHGLDLEAEVKLPVGLEGRERPIKARAFDPEQIFLTGATGFLGSFLLDSLLRRTSAQITCLVRAEDEACARKRIQDSLDYYELPYEPYADRIIPLVGDLAEPRFGLDDQAWQALRQRTDVIYHNGARVNFSLSYGRLKAPNVGGTLTILELAQGASMIPIHFVSSSGVFPLDAYQNVPPIREDEPLVAHEGLEHGYAQTKWVSDRIMQLARSRGFPVNVFRPGRITAHSVSGAANDADVLGRMVAGWIQLGFAPEVPIPVQMIPVDYVSEAIVVISRKSSFLNRNFHIFNEPYPLGALIADIRDHGYPVRQVPPDVWMDRVTGKLQEDPGNPIYGLITTIAGSGNKDEGAPKPILLEPDCDESNCLAGLAGSGISCPRLSRDIIGAYLRFFTRKEIIPSPPATPKPREKALETEN